MDEVAELEPGTALDLGCGRGGDAIWLAAARNATAAGVADAITWERHDLAVSLPAGTFDLVASTFLHSPVALPRTRILRAAAAAVAPGGTLLIVGHAPSASHPHAELPSAPDVVEDLALPAEHWRLNTSEHRDTEHAFGDETPTTRTDSVVRLQRAPS